MHPALKNLIAVITGIIIGSIVNMALIGISGAVIPPPEGVDMKTAEGLKTAMHLLEPRHFIFPFLAHALGTFAGAWITAKIAATVKMRFALAIGIFFLAGGVANIFMLPGAPVWFCVLDLVLAYIPMAWLAGKAAIR
ncbi:MAG: hypothetical protein JNL13_12680 [Chitinophagaceae bacterium]|nr:hypothetical protein [Chitinophagaceae bacterium]